MTGAELTNSISHNFIVQMIPHHEAAVAMSKNILTYTRNEELKTIAENIISEQTRNIEDMRAILEESEKVINCSYDLQGYQNQLNSIFQTMFHRMRNACTSNRIDANFIREMIPHHMGAVNMSEATLRYCIYSGLRPILRGIISSQQRGIAQMRSLLNRLKAEP